MRDSCATARQPWSAAFQEELATLYDDRPKRAPPVSPGLVAVVTILLAFTRASDAEAVDATVLDRRGHLALDGLHCTAAPFSQGTLVAFRPQLIVADLHRRLIERTVELAAQTKRLRAHAVVRGAGQQSLSRTKGRGGPGPKDGPGSARGS